MMLLRITHIKNHFLNSYYADIEHSGFPDRNERHTVRFSSTSLTRKGAFNNLKKKCPIEWRKFIDWTGIWENLYRLRYSGEGLSATFDIEPTLEQGYRTVKDIAASFYPSKEIQ